MMIGWCRFNIYLFVALVIACGCRSPESKRNKQLAMLRLHLEARRDATDHTQEVSILREHPISLTVERAPFLTEAEVKEAKVIDATGGFALRIQFDRHGALLLEQYSVANRGKRFAVFTEFGEKLKEIRWLAAPVIARRIT